MTNIHDPEFVVDRTVKVDYPESIPYRLLATQIVTALVEKRHVEVREAIRDLLATATPFELKDDHTETHLDVVVSVHPKAQTLKHAFEKTVQESAFSDWRKTDGKSHIISRTFGIMPQIQRFAIVDRQGFVNLRDPETFKISEANREKLAELFFPGKPSYYARSRIKFEHNKAAPGFAELVVFHADKLRTEIQLGKVIYPLYSLESKEEKTEQILDFVALSNSLEKKLA